MKKLFSNVWFKCITVLLVIAMISGGLLALLNDLLYVSPAERSMRAIVKIYGEEKEFATILDTDSDDETLNTSISYDEFGEITKIYKIENQDSYDLLFRTTGTGGYKNGTITLWVQVVCTSQSEKIENVVLEGFEKQTLMSKLDGSYYDGFLVDVSGEYFSTEQSNNSIYHPVSNATYSATAGNNAINCVIKYLRGVN